VSDRDEDVAAALDRRRRALASRWNLRDELVLIRAGESIPIPGRGDQTYAFRAHSEYLYLTDRERPGGVLAFDPQEGWVDFVFPVSREEMLWAGGAAQPEGVPVSELERWLAKRRGRPIGNLGAQARAETKLDARLRGALNQLRRQKDEIELGRMCAAERATRLGFGTAVSMLEPGTTERAVQIELEAEFRRGGADGPAYDTIVGGGPNSAVLHFAPTQRPFGAGELVLIDAGAEYRGYASDVTRTYPVGGRFTPEQAELHAIVHRANLAAIERCTAGTEFTEVHLAAARVIGQGLVEAGLLRGAADALVERATVSLFFPHGVGHMVGLGVRDASEILPGRRRDPARFPGLRIDLPLLPGHVVTIEPGIYFVPALLNDPEMRARHRDAVDWDRVDRLLGFGGIRIEDDVLVTEGAPEVLTADIPLLG
jgi:Xaa-Pro aminopeptidase